MGPTVDEIMHQLEMLGSEQTKKVLMRHGACEPFFGVKIEELKKIQKKIKKDYQLAKDLYATGNSDAMYLAGLIADDQKMTKKDLQLWVKNAYWYMISCCTVAWVAAESRFGWELATEWIESNKEQIAAAGWSTFSSLVGFLPDEQLDLEKLEDLIQRVENTIHDQPNRVRYTMNGFIIAVGGGVAALTERAKQAGTKIGKVEVDMGGTSCKVPEVVPYLEKMEKMKKIGNKRKTTKC